MIGLSKFLVLIALTIMLWCPLKAHAQEPYSTDVISNRLKSLRQILKVHSYLTEKFVKIMEDKDSFSNEEIDEIMRLSSHLSEYIDEEGNPKLIENHELYDEKLTEFKVYSNKFLAPQPPPPVDFREINPPQAFKIKE